MTFSKTAFAAPLLLSSLIAPAQADSRYLAVCNLSAESVQQERQVIALIHAELDETAAKEKGHSQQVISDLTNKLYMSALEQMQSSVAAIGMDYHGTTALVHAIEQRFKDYKTAYEVEHEMPITLQIVSPTLPLSSCKVSKTYKGVDFMRQWQAYSKSPAAKNAQRTVDSNMTYVHACTADRSMQTIARYTLRFGDDAPLDVRSKFSAVAHTLFETHVADIHGAYASELNDNRKVKGSTITLSGQHFLKQTEKAIATLSKTWAMDTAVTARFDAPVIAPGCDRTKLWQTYLKAEKVFTRQLEKYGYATPLPGKRFAERASHSIR